MISILDEKREARRLDSLRVFRRWLGRNFPPGEAAKIYLAAEGNVRRAPWFRTMTVAMRTAHWHSKNRQKIAETVIIPFPDNTNGNRR